jgi:hypothetical protein
VIQPRELVGADALDECEPANLERSQGVLRRPASELDGQQRDSALGLRLGEPLRTATEVAEILGVAPGCVRRLERSALQKLGYLLAWLDSGLAPEEPIVGAPSAAIRYFPSREPVARAGAPRRELHRRHPQAWTS